jgi:hypothetical protein
VMRLELPLIYGIYAPKEVPLGGAPKEGPLGGRPKGLDPP